MEHIYQTLEQIGLNKKESDIYIALLKAGSIGATRISQITSINRVTTYGILDSLIARGFVVSLKKNSTKQFQAIKPSKIAQMLEQKKTQFDAITSDLENISFTEQKKKSVTLYEGKKAVIELMTEIFGSGKTVHSFGNMEIPEKKHYFETQNIRKIQLQKKTKIIGITNKIPTEKVDPNMWSNLTKVNIAPSLSKLTTWTYIWDGKVANVSYEKGLVGEVIEDEEFASTMMHVWNTLLLTCTK